MIPRQEPRQITRTKRQIRLHPLLPPLLSSFPTIFPLSSINQSKHPPQLPQPLQTLAVKNTGIDRAVRRLEFRRELGVEMGELGLQGGAEVAVVVALCFVGVALVG